MERIPLPHPVVNLVVGTSQVPHFAEKKTRRVLVAPVPPKPALQEEGEVQHIMRDANAQHSETSWDNSNLKDCDQFFFLGVLARSMARRKGPSTHTMTHSDYRCPSGSRYSFAGAGRATKSAERSCKPVRSGSSKHYARSKASQSRRAFRAAGLSYM